MKKNILKKVLIIILLILIAVIIIFAVHTIRNFVIISDLQEMLSVYTQKTNYHIKGSRVNTKTGELIAKGDFYKKDGKIASVTKNNDETSKVLVYFNGIRKDVFVETPEEKTAYIDTNIGNYDIPIEDYLECDNTLTKFLACAKARISSIEYNGKNCYLITDYSFLNAYDDGINETYIEKNTGLFLKRVDKEEIYEREYEFDNVNDSVFKEPDIGEYKIGDK